MRVKQSILSVFRHKIALVAFCIVFSIVFLMGQSQSTNSTIKPHLLSKQEGNHSKEVLNESFFSAPKSPSQPCKILYYTNFYRFKWLGGQAVSNSFFSPSTTTNCIVTSNRNYLPSIRDFDALIFFQWNLHEEFPPPESRHPDQLYILQYLESPQRSLRRIKAGNRSHLFNLTMSYRLDSDIVWAYGRVNDKRDRRIEVAPQRHRVPWRPVNKSFRAKKGLRQLVRRKTRMAAWVVSNCKDDPSERFKMVKSLQKFMKVDIYGKCGTPCNRSPNCKSQLAKENFFYFAFENSLAQDYISEKTFSVLGQGVIPVVYGGADYAKHLPPKSYINAQDFNTTKDLADFLVKLSRNTEEYLSYFWWTEHYTTRIASYEKLCEKVQEMRKDSGKKSQFYTDLDKWEHEGTWRKRTIQFS